MDRDTASHSQQPTESESAPRTDAAASIGPQTRLIALLNQKGGVGKTTTTVNLGAALAQKRKRVLLIDLDPQAHLTLHVGIDPQTIEHSVYSLLSDDQVSPFEVVQQVRKNLAVLPGEVNLAGLESELSQLAQGGTAQRVLRDRVAPLLATGAFDYVLMDCPPSLGLLTVNALAMAREVIVPLQAHFLALQGLAKLLETVSLVREGLNPELRVSGIALCMHEGQTVLASEVVQNLNDFLASGRDQDVAWRDAQLLTPPIRRNIKLAESPSFGQTIFQYEPDCAGAKDYLALAQCLINQPATSDSAAQAASADSAATAPSSSS